MILFPNAKINIGLRITEKRIDGYHNIQTAFYPINLTDILEFIESQNLTFTNTGLQIDTTPGNNLIIKAYYLLQKTYKLPPLNIHLHKVIPFGAGLGGGSSDAAFMLKGLNDYFDLKLSDSQLTEYAVKLGADCAFFIKNESVYAEGIGDIFSAINLDLNNYHIVLVKPDLKMNTALAYKNIKPKKPEKSLKELLTEPISQWKNTIINDFEAIVFEKYHQVQIIKQKLYEFGALFALMSGSGTSVYGIFQNKIDLKNSFSDCFVWQNDCK